MRIQNICYAYSHAARILYKIIRNTLCVNEPWCMRCAPSVFAVRCTTWIDLLNSFCIWAFELSNSVRFVTWMVLFLVSLLPFMYVLYDILNFRALCAEMHAHEIRYSVIIYKQEFSISVIFLFSICVVNHISLVNQFYQRWKNPFEVPKYRKSW